jgi:regulator of nucleoside diphosphate kinase
MTARQAGEVSNSPAAIRLASPLGASLLGLRVGDVARWRTPDGREHAARVVALLFQPEALHHLRQGLRVLPDRRGWG